MASSPTLAAAATRVPLDCGERPAPCIFERLVTRADPHARSGPTPGPLALP